MRGCFLKCKYKHWSFILRQLSQSTRSSFRPPSLYLQYVSASLIGSGVALLTFYQYLKYDAFFQNDTSSSVRFEAVYCQQKNQKLVDSFREIVSRELELFRVSNGIPGIICQVQVGDIVVFKQGFGYCDIENLRLCDPENATFRIASISKLVTGLLAIKLASEGKLDLDDSIYKYLPDFPRKEVDGENVDITIRQLLSHTGGIRHYVRPDSKLSEDEKVRVNAIQSQRNDKFVSLTETIKVFKDDPLCHKPGTKFLYSTYSFVLLSAVLERVIDKPFHECIHDFVRQLGLTHTKAEPTPASREMLLNRMPCYMFDYKKQKLTLAPEVTLMHKTAGGGLVSDLSDMCKLGGLLAKSFSGERPILPGMRSDLMAQVVNPPVVVDVPNRKYRKYSLGFYVMEKDPSYPEGTVIIGHSGASTGLCSFLAICAPGGDWSNPVVVTIAANIQEKSLQVITETVIRQTISLIDGASK